MIKAIYAVFIARLREFYRDKASLSWSFLFPFFIIVAFYFAFSDDGQKVFQVGVVSEQKIADIDLDFLKLEYIHFIPVAEEPGIEKVKTHKLDILIQPLAEQVNYWINSSSKNGYFLEKMLMAEKTVPVMRAQVEGKELSYVDWVFPGIIAMNIMFSCLWGVGYSIVKYRQDGYLKRLKATPIKAYQFLLGQIVARFIIAFFVSAIVYFGGAFITGFQMHGSYFDLFILYSAGVFSLLTIGLLVASRTTSKEFADGILNLASWPMMFLSGVWFSLESASEGLVAFANLLPLTHMLFGMRAIMNEGKTLADVSPQFFTLLGTGIILLIICSLIFKWGEE